MNQSQVALADFETPDQSGSLLAEVLWRCPIAKYLIEQLRQLRVIVAGFHQLGNTEAQAFSWCPRFYDTESELCCSRRLCKPVTTLA